MIAVDTNVLVRYFVRDDPRQTIKAKELVELADIFVPLSVILETEWVLRDSYKFSSADVHAALKAFAALPNVTLEHAERLDQTLAWVESGLDLPDALHLASSAESELFATFDKTFAKRANAARLAPLVKLL